MLSIRNYMKVAGMAAIALTAFSCSQEEFEGAGVKGVTLNATFETPATRTSVNESNQVVWNQNDAFKLFCTQGSESKTATFTTTTADGNSSSAAFSSADLTTTDGASAVYAIFPADIAPTAAPTNFNSVELNLPATIEADKYKESNGAMLAKPDDLSGSLQFRHMAGLLKLTITAGLNADAKSLVIEADKAISGKFTVDMTGNDPVIKTVESPTNEGAKKITISLSLTADQTEGEVIYVPIPTGTYTTLSATIYDDNGTALYTDKTWNDVTVTRASMMTATFGFTTIEAGAETNNSLAAVLPNEVPEAPITTNVEITGDLGNANLTGGLQIPVFANSNVNLVLNTVPTGTSTSNPLVISEKEVQTDATPVAAVNNLTLTMPAAASGSEPSVSINMPKTTVALEAPEDATEVTYAEVTANTAVSTLVIGKGVTVKNLVIKGGNVKVYGTVEKLSRAAENTSVVEVASFGAADIKEVTEPANFKFASTWDGVSKIAPASDATAYNIYTAAQLAGFQISKLPSAGFGANMDATVSKNVNIYAAEIDLMNQPWSGMVLGENVLFNGAAWNADEMTQAGTTVQQTVVKNVKLTQHALSESGYYTPQACVGFIAVAKKNSQIKNIAIDGFKAEGEGVEAKWSGALVGYSYGAKLYENCSANNVSILTESINAYRVGGLIGFIGDENTILVEVKNCHASNVTIKANFSIGGLVGTVQGSASRIFTGCTTQGVSISLSENSSALKGAFSKNSDYPRGWWNGPYGWTGTVSLFVGDVNMKESAVLTLTDCEAKDEAFTAAQKTSFGFDDTGNWSYFVGDTEAQTEQNKTNAMNGAEYYKLEDSTSKLISAKVLASTTVAITIDGTKQVGGTDYNRYTKLASQTPGETTGGAADAE